MLHYQDNSFPIIDDRQERNNGLVVLVFEHPDLLINMLHRLTIFLEQLHLINLKHHRLLPPQILSSKHFRESSFSNLLYYPEISNLSLVIKENHAFTEGLNILSFFIGFFDGGGDPFLGGDDYLFGFGFWPWRLDKCFYWCFYGFDFG